jgi:hypothetical protein
MPTLQTRPGCRLQLYEDTDNLLIRPELNSLLGENNLLIQSELNNLLEENNLLLYGGIGRQPTILTMTYPV